MADFLPHLIFVLLREIMAFLCPEVWDLLTILSEFHGNDLLKNQKQENTQE